MRCEKVERTDIIELCKRKLGADETEEIMWGLLNSKFGKNNDLLLAGFLSALYVRGQTADETIGLIRAVESDGIKITKYPRKTLGIVGSGRDEFKTLNVSTAAAIIAASAEQPTVKNGCRAESSKTGTTDVLEELGADVECSEERSMNSLKQNFFTLCAAEKYYPRMIKHYVGKVNWRNALSLILSIASPIPFDNVVFGISAPSTVIDNSVTVEVLQRIGPENCLLVSGFCGGWIDEISIAGETNVVEIRNGKIRKSFQIEPSYFGVKPIKPQIIAQRQTHRENAMGLLDGLSGQNKEIRDFFCANAAAGLYVAKKVNNLRDGFELARQKVDDGTSIKTLKKFILCTGRKPAWNF